MNAITYKEVFPLIKNDKLWLGTTSPKEFRDGNHSSTAPLKKFGNICWFTNIDHGRRHEPLVLMTVKDNLRYSKKLTGMTEYATYDNYDAIEVPQTKLIPSDYAGVMGVPISFLDKYDPEQFEIIGLDRYVPDNPRYGHRFHINGEEIYARIIIRHRNPAK
jgi:hypothetical protein